MKRFLIFWRNPDPEKLESSLSGEMIINETFLCLKEGRKDAAELAELLNLSEEQVDSALRVLQKKRMIDADLDIIGSHATAF